MKLLIPKTTVGSVNLLIMSTNFWPAYDWINYTNNF